ncbi:cell wall synthase accessory phosphoprotein MacP [Streptococcus orisasini]|uniref:cell wall synthase accessory phosphoprotein MacP n=1 Tax=Streptococcus orisasini TaxID=1080071 RepID=UPI00070B2373|nr:cell wall synthase accessory phosphoprotein MacP [Streptococcus orisasini]
MGKPLLTDEMIARANRGEKFYEEDDFDPEKTIVIRTDSQKVSPAYDSSSDFADEDEEDFDFGDYDEDPIIKSRRIENAKRGEFQSKLNWILIGIGLLLAILIYAVFKL